MHIIPMPRLQVTITPKTMISRCPYLEFEISSKKNYFKNSCNFKVCRFCEDSKALPYEISSKIHFATHRMYVEMLHRTNYFCVWQLRFAAAEEETLS